MADNDHRRQTPALVRYFRDCLLADSGERELNDIFSSGEREHILVEAATGGIPDTIVLPAGTADQFFSVAQLLRQELRPLIGAPIICGLGASDRDKRIRAPLFIADVQVEKSGAAGYRIATDQESLRLNPVVLTALNLPMEWAKDVPVPDSPDFATLLARLHDLPQFTARPSLEQLRTYRGKQLTQANTALLWLSARTHTAASTAFELEAMATAEDLSPCVQQILGSQMAPSPAPAPVPESLPRRLTSAQEQALVNAARETLSVVHGAPGTGKTYTIAGIVADRVMQEECVLVVCSNDHAADVVYDHLSTSLAGADQMAVRAGSGDHRQRLLQQLDALLHKPRGGQAKEPADGNDDTPDSLARSMQQGIKAQRQTAARFQGHLANSEILGGVLGSGNALWRGLKERWHAWRTRRQALLAETWIQYRRLMADHQEMARHLLGAKAARQRDHLLRENRDELVGLATALRARNSGNRSQRMSAIDWKILTRTFPVWVVSTSTLDRTLPLSAGLFDLVIIDEATQCNIAQALPALQRAKRSVIVGDPRQLRHFSFLARARQEILAETHQVNDARISLDYRERSLLDFAMAALAHNDAQTWLDEHFRSHPHLINFSNDHFYEGRLKIMTDVHQIIDRPPRHVVSCPIRIDEDINEGEVEAIIDHLHKAVAESANLPAEGCPSIGVVAFFSSLAQVLEKRIVAEFGLATIDRHDILVATPYGFQGQERDLILLGTGVFPGRSHSAWAYLERPDVFNVAITRAKHRQVVFIPEGLEEIRRHGLLFEYLHAEPPPLSASRSEDNLLGRMRQEVIEELERIGAHCWTDFPLGGHSVDLLATLDDQALAIDLVGCPTAVGSKWPLERYHLLDRAGLPVLPIAYGEWLWRRNDVLAILTRTFGDQRAERGQQRARQIADLRWRFEKLGHAEYLAILDDLATTLEQLHLWLGRRFSVTELTYQRYSTGIERASQATLAELSGICLLLEESRALDFPPQELTNRTSTALESSRRAVDSLTALARKLALMTPSSDIDAAVEDIGALEARLASYQDFLSAPENADV